MHSRKVGCQDQDHVVKITWPHKAETQNSPLYHQRMDVILILQVSPHIVSVIGTIYVPYTFCECENC